jgi:hypothetical protein
MDESMSTQDQTNFNLQWKTISRKRHTTITPGLENECKKATRDPRGPNYMLPTKSTPLEIQNKFSVLPIDEPATSNDVLKEEKQTRPPPIHLQCDMNYKNLQQELIKLVGQSGFSCTSTHRGVTIYPSTPADYRAIVRALRDCGAPFHTYQLPQDKAYRIVIRGLHSSVPTEDISQELTERGYSVRNVVNVISREKIKLPLFFVDLEPNANNKHVFEITSMINSRIKIEEPHQRRQLVQCKLCQNYGHSKNYCNLQPRCVRCGEAHNSTDCKKDKNLTPTCALCKGAHPSNYRGCIIHRELQHRRAPQNKATPQHTYNPDLNSISAFPTLQNNDNNRNSDTSNIHPSTQRRTYAETITNDRRQTNECPDVSSLLSNFLTEMRALFTPVITLITQLVQYLIPHGK